MKLIKNNTTNQEFNKINHVIKIDFYVNPSTWTQITDCRTESACLWNRMVKLHLRFRKRNKSWPTQSQFEKHFKKKFDLHSQIVQALIEKFFANIQTTKTLRKNCQKSARYPYKLKQFVNPIWKTQGVKIENNRIFLSMGVDPKTHKYRKSIKLRIPELPIGEVVQAELGYGQLFLTIQTKTLKVKPEALAERATKTSKIAAIDLGIIHLGVITDGVESLAVVGRGLRSLNQGLNKNLAKINLLQSKCQKHSRKYSKLQKRKRKFLKKRDNQKHDILHKSANKIVQFCEEKEITKLIVGDIADINRNNGKGGKKKKKRKRSRRLNQELGYMSLGMLITYLTYKLKEKGVEVEKYSESYTSQTCPSCGLRNKPQGRVYACKGCKYLGIRDEVGAMNLLNKWENKGAIEPQRRVPKGKIKYLRAVKFRRFRKKGNLVERSRANDTGQLSIHARSADI